MMRRLLAWILTGALLLPLALLVMLSLARHWTWPAVLPAEWQVRLWRDMLTDAGSIQDAAWRSMGMAVGVSVLATALGFPTSRELAGLRRRGHLLALIHLPYALSPVVLGVSLLYVFLKLDLAGHIIGVMLAQLVFAYAYAVILMSGFWNSQTEAIVQVARTLGARPRQVWWRVLVPMATPMLTVCLLQTFLISWFDYPLALLIGTGQVQTLALRLFEYFNAGDVRLAATCALLLMIPPLLGLLINHRLIAIPNAPYQDSQDE